jgi:DHA2 family multidrug resistance protein-like MFS transporter
MPAQRTRLAVAAVLSAMALVVLDANIVNVALPMIGGSLRTSPAASVLVVTAYQAGLIMALLPMGAVGERFGYRRVFAIGVAVFSLGSLFCALAPNMAWLVVSRFLQGLGGAAVMALGVALLRFSVGADRLGAAIGWNALTVALASAAGPAIGGAILANASWHWLFAVNVPIGAVALLAARALPPAGGRKQALDWGSAALNAVSFGCLILAAELLPRHPAPAVGLLVIACAAAALLLRRERSKAAPLVPLDLLRSASFRGSVIASVCCFAGQTAGLVALPFFLHDRLGQSPAAIAACMMVWPLSVALMAPIAGRLSDRHSTARLCIAGALVLAGGLALAALAPSDGTAYPVAGCAVLCGAGFGLFQTANNRNLFLSAPAARSGAAGAMQGTARLAGQTAGALGVTLLFATAPAASTPQAAFAIGAALACAAAVASAGRLSRVIGSLRASDACERRGHMPCHR